MLDHKWFDFAKAVVNEMACVKKNENLLILADTWTAITVAELCFEAGRNLGAKTNLMVIPMMPHDDVSELDPILSNAILAADVVIGALTAVKVRHAHCGEQGAIEFFGRKGDWDSQNRADNAVST